ncbi:MAG TPA: hypothetical protein VIG33_07210 [Pseudobdellovibrionaceae bacterium]
MSRTYKDKNVIYLPERKSPVKHKREHQLRGRYSKYKKEGPPLDADNCYDCGGPTDFQGGFLVCSECGHAEGVLDVIDYMELIAA